MLAAAVRSRKESILWIGIERNPADRALDDFIVDLDAAIIDEADQACPAREGIADRSGKGTLPSTEGDLTF